MTPEPPTPRVDVRSHAAHEDDDVVVTLSFGDDVHGLTRQGARELIRMLEDALERADWSRE